MSPHDLIYFLIAIWVANGSVQDITWRWECEEGHCQKTRVTEETKDSALSLAACQLFCGKYGRLWPMPTGEFYTGNYLLHVNMNSIDVLFDKESDIGEIATMAAARFKEQIAQLVPSGKVATGGRSLEVNLAIADPSANRLTYATDESYKLKISEFPDGRINATISSVTFFGARHGLETLSQLIIYDPVRQELQIVRDVSIGDAPEYPHRGILLDTSRNYIPVNVIKRTLDGMASSKLNTFHWHITDSHSFPFVSKSRPELAKLGAYSDDQVYTPKDIVELVKYGMARGVRLLPEFDAPAHVGEGWQDTGFVACLNAHPWQTYCVEPPCGQLDPTQDNLYEYLEGIYGDMVELFKPDVFHMGGDEVSNSCWNSTESIVTWMKNTKSWGRTPGDFLKLWNYFQERALRKLYDKTGEKIPIIMWTSALTQTNKVEDYLPKDTYIIQIWTNKSDQQVQELLNKGYKIILSNSDALYLDCGFSGWVDSGNNWCSPYKGWQLIYDNSPMHISNGKTDQILGAEATLWTEQVDGSSVDGRLWPRAAAMAERLWAEPGTNWRHAETRMLIHRDRLVNMGIAAEALEPQWCLQNEQHCPVGGRFNY